MGGSESKQTKAIDTNGQVNNNVVIGKFDGEINVYSIEIVVLLGIICLIKIIEFVYFVYRRHYQNIKKRVSDHPALRA